MKNLAFLLLFFSTSLFGQITEVKSTIKEVTLFPGNAQIHRTAKVKVQPGDNMIKLVFLSPKIDSRSIRITSSSDVIIKQTNFSSYTAQKGLNPVGKKPLILRKEAKEKEIKRLEAKISGLNYETHLLQTNSESLKSRNLPLNDFQQLSTYYRTRREQIKNELYDLAQQREVIEQSLNEILLDIAKIENVVTEEFGQIEFEIGAEKAEEIALSIDFLVRDAGWEPVYEVSAEEVNKPLKLQLKARVIQHTQIDWKSAILKFSNGDPAKGTTAPTPYPWYINQPFPKQATSKGRMPRPVNKGTTGRIHGEVKGQYGNKPLEKAVVLGYDFKGNLVFSQLTDFDGKFTGVSDKPVYKLIVMYYGYNFWQRTYPGNNALDIILIKQEEVEIVWDAPLIEKGKTSIVMEEAEINNMPQRNVEALEEVVILSGVRSKGTSSFPQTTRIVKGATQQQFVSKKPYTVYSENDEIQVPLQTYFIPATFEYFAAPRWDEDAFLQAFVKGWDTLGLVSGNMKVFLEGVYVGQTYLNAESVEDELTINFGRDQNVAIQRKLNPVTKKKGFLSSKNSAELHYEIIVRNNKSVPIHLKLVDQIPLMPTEKYKIEDLMYDNGALNDKTGIIIWDLNLDSGKQEIKNLKYKLSWPTGGTVYF